MTAPELVASLEAKGIRLFRVGKNLRTWGVLTQEMRDALIANKSEVLAVIDSRLRRLEPEQCQRLGIPPALLDGSKPVSLVRGGYCQHCNDGPGWTLAYEDNFWPVCVRCASRLVPDPFGPADSFFIRDPFENA